jgi:hypothetical protein
MDACDAVKRAATELAALERELKALYYADGAARDAARRAVWFRIGRLSFWLDVARQSAIEEGER